MLMGTIIGSPSTERNGGAMLNRAVANLGDHKGGASFMALRIELRIWKPLGFKTMAVALLASGLGLAQSPGASPPAQPPKPAAAKPAWPPEGPTPRTADG